MSRERERKLQNDLEAAAARLLHQEQTNTELRRKQDQLIIMIKQQQEENCCNEELLRQVSSELLCLQSSEVTLESLVEGLHAEAQHRAALAEDLEAQLYAEVQCRAALSESLQTELRSKTEEVEKLQDANKTLEEELQDLHNAHHKEITAVNLLSGRQTQIHTTIALIISCFFIVLITSWLKGKLNDVLLLRYDNCNRKMRGV
ncbi:hypothetical protein PAMA_017011 [Pampus argenteus]